MLELLNPLFFVVGGAVGVLIPLVLHLIQARRTVRLPFGTLRFLRMADRKSSNRIRLENLLLWLIRTALLLILALAFAMPMLRRQSFGSWLGRAGRDVAVVIDGSYSMAYQMGRETAWNRALEQAVAVIEGLGEQDRFCVFVARDRVEPVIEQLSANREEGMRRVKALAFSQTSSQLAPALADACAVLKDVKEKREREIHIITDGQALPWESLGAATTNAAAAAIAWDPRQAGERTPCFVSLLGATAPENLWLASVEVNPSLLMEDTPARVAVKLGHAGPVAATAASLLVDGTEVASRAMSAGDGAAGDLTFSLPPLAKGPHAASVHLPDDNLSLDNTFHFLLRVENRIPVLGVGRTDDRFFLRAALNVGASALQVKWIDPQELATEKLDAYACIVLCNAIPLSAQEVAAAEHFVEAGGLLAIYPGDRAAPADYQAWHCLPGVPARMLELPLSQRKQILNWESSRHSILEELRIETSPPEVTVRRQLAWDSLEKDAATLIGHGGDRPFLLGRPFGRGYVMLFSVPADRSWSDFPLSPFYLPIAHQILQYGAGVGRLAPYVWCTPNLALSEHLPAATAETILRGPDGAAVPVRSALAGAQTVLTVENLMQAGIYRMAVSGSTNAEPALAVNMRRGESDLAPVDAGSLRDRLGLKFVHVAHDRQELLAQIQESRVGRTLGEPLLWLALLLAAIEFFYANRLMQTDPGLAGRLKIEASGKITAADAGGEAAS